MIIEKRKIKKLIKPISYINNLVPKKKNVILIYSNLGFRDNVKSLYDYLIEKKYNEKYVIVCSLSDFRKYKKTSYKNVFYVNNIIGFIIYFFSKYVFYSFGCIPVVPSKKQCVVNMWHGMPLKKICLLEEKKNNDYFNYFTYVISTSIFFKPIMAKAFGCNTDQIVICGQPRTDQLKTDANVLSLLNIEEYNKRIIWMPTFRSSKKLGEYNSCEDYNGLPLFKSNLEIKKLNDYLNKMNIIIYIKLHPMQDMFSTEILNYSNIRFINDEYLEKRKIALYSFLGSFDALITDYSSVFIDFLLVDKPIAFTVEDINQYRENRGFVIDDPYKMMCGSKLKNKDDFLMFVKELSINNDVYKEERNNLKKQLHAYDDFVNTKRMLDLFKITLK